MKEIEKEKERVSQMERYREKKNHRVRKVIDRERERETNMR